MSLSSLVGDLLGGASSSAMQYYFNKDLMGYANNVNRYNLVDGPRLQRRGLEAAGYNPLLALSGYSSGLPNISPLSVGQADLSSIGSSALNASRAKSEAELNKQREEVAKTEVDVKKATADDLGASKQLKDALRDKAEADATKTKVETFTEPARVVSGVLSAGATAYGAKKIHDMFKDKGAVRGMNSLQRRRIEQLRKVVNGASRKNFPVLSSMGLLGSSLLSGAFSAKNTKTLMDFARREGHWTDKHGIERNPKWIYGGVPVVP